MRDGITIAPPVQLRPTERRRQFAVSRRRRGQALFALLSALALLHGSTRPAAAQQSVSEVLSFLVTNRSIPTDDFARDEQAAAATRDTISGLLLSQLAALPISSSAGGFTYRLNPALGAVERSTDSFGPFFTERSLTVGESRASFGVNYQHASFTSVDGRRLRNGSLVSTASRLRGEAEPFDVETLTLRMQTDTVTLIGNFGITDRLDVGAALPFVRLTLSGQRLDTYRGRALIQATGSASASGLSDIVVRAKYNVMRRGGSGVAVGAESRLPTGNEDNLLGAGQATITPRAMASYESDRVTVHGDLGYALGGLSEELAYNGAVTVVAAPRLTLVGELVGRRLESSGRLTDTITPHPTLAGVETLRLTGVQNASNRLLAVAGLKWNINGTWLITANVLRPLTDAGLNAPWVPTVAFDYSFGR